MKAFSCKSSARVTPVDSVSPQSQRTRPEKPRWTAAGDKSKEEPGCCSASKIQQRVRASQALRIERQPSSNDPVKRRLNEMRYGPKPAVPPENEHQRLKSLLQEYQPLVNVEAERNYQRRLVQEIKRADRCEFRKWAQDKRMKVPMPCSLGVNSEKTDPYMQSEGESTTKTPQTSSFSSMPHPPASVKAASGLPQDLKAKIIETQMRQAAVGQEPEVTRRIKERESLKQRLISTRLRASGPVFSKFTGSAASQSGLSSLISPSTGQLTRKNSKIEPNASGLLSRSAKTANSSLVKLHGVQTRPSQSRVDFSLFRSPALASQWATEVQLVFLEEKAARDEESERLARFQALTHLDNAGSGSSSGTKSAR